jgi:hypothetical protein
VGLDGAAESIAVRLAAIELLVPILSLVGALGAGRLGSAASGRRGRCSQALLLEKPIPLSEPAIFVSPHG